MSKKFALVLIVIALSTQLILAAEDETKKSETSLDTNAACPSGCSERGTCDPKTNVCICNEGFSGIACQDSET